MASGIMKKLKYRNGYLCQELVDIFFYTKGVQHVKEILLRHMASPSMKEYVRLINSCYDNVREQYPKPSENGDDDGANKD